MHLFRDSSSGPNNSCNLTGVDDVIVVTVASTGNDLAGVGDTVSVTVLGGARRDITGIGNAVSIAVQRESRIEITLIGDSIEVAVGAGPIRDVGRVFNSVGVTVDEWEVGDQRNHECRCAGIRSGTDTQTKNNCRQNPGDTLENTGRSVSHG